MEKNAFAFYSCSRRFPPRVPPSLSCRRTVHIDSTPCTRGTTSGGDMWPRRRRRLNDDGRRRRTYLSCAGITIIVIVVIVRGLGTYDDINDGSTVCVCVRVTTTVRNTRRTGTVRTVLVYIYCDYDYDRAKINGSSDAPYCYASAHVMFTHGAIRAHVGWRVRVPKMSVRWIRDFEK